MALNFPPSPTLGQIYAGGANSSTWIWNGQAWVIYSREYGIDWSQIINGGGLPRHITSPETLNAGQGSVVYDLWVWDSLTIAGANASYPWGTSTVGNEALLNIKKDLNIDGTFTNYGVVTFDLPEQHPPHNANYFDFSSGAVTTISSAGVWYILNCTTTAGFSYGDLSITNNRITNDGTLKRFEIQGIASVSAGNNQSIHLAFYKNGSIWPCSEQDGITTSGGKASAIPFHCVLELDTGDYIEVWIKNQTAAHNITLDNVNVIVTEITR